MADNSLSKRLFRYAPLFLWIGVIFLLSSQAGAISETSRFVRPLLRWIFPLTPESTLEVYHGFIRKSAHFLEYAVLALLALRALSRTHFQTLRLHRYLFALLVTFVVASIDEFNQSLNPARTGTFYDVLLDLSGGIFALALFWLLSRSVSWIRSS